MLDYFGFGKFGVGRVGVRLGFVEGGGGAVALDEDASAGGRGEHRPADERWKYSQRAIVRRRAVDGVHRR